jgi:hypothetical protein
VAQPQRVLVEELEPTTTALVSSARFVNENRELGKELWQAHRELTDWIFFLFTILRKKYIVSV